MNVVTRAGVLLFPLWLACQPPPAGSSETTAFAVEPPFAFDVVHPQAPRPPALPVLTPCPPGWSEVASRLVTTCEPWPGGTAQACPVGEFHLPGTSGCQRLGAGCPASGWPESLPMMGLVLYVRAGASGGDGSRANPVGSIDAALSLAAGRPATLALSAGTHPVSRAVPGGTTLLGACVNDTVLTGPATSSAIVSTSGEVVVRGVQITGPTAGVEARGARALVTVEDVWLHDLTAFALGLQGGARIEARRVAVERTTVDPMSVNGGAVIFGDGALNVTDAVITAASSAGVQVEGSGRVTLANVAVRDTRDAAGGAVGWALNLKGGTLTATGVVIEGGGAGVTLTNGASGQLIASLIRGTLRDDAVRASGATFVGERLLLDATSGLPLRSGEQADVTVRDVVNRRQFQCQARTGGRLTVERVLAEEPRSPVLTVNGVMSRLVVADLTVTPPRPGVSQTQFGTGLIAYLDGQLTLTRAHFEQVLGNAATITQRATATLTDVVIDEGAPSRLDGRHALVASTEATVTLERVRLRRMLGTGVGAWDARTTLTLRDVEIAETQALPGSGIGVVVADGARATATRLRLTDNAGVSLMLGRQGVLEAGEVHVGATTLPCLGLPECDGRIAVGLGVYSGGSARVSRFVLSNSGIGAQLSDGTLGLADGDVAFNEIALSVLSPSFEVASVSSGVRYRHNQQRLSSQVVPLPEIPPIPLQ